MAKRELDQVTDGECQPAAVRRPTASILHFAASWIPSRRFSCHHLKYQTRIMFPLFHPGDRFRLTFDRLVRSCPCAEPENWTQIPSRKYRQQMASRRSLKKGYPLFPHYFQADPSCRNPAESEELPHNRDLISRGLRCCCDSFLD